MATTRMPSVRWANEPEGGQMRRQVLGMSSVPCSLQGNEECQGSEPGISSGGGQSKAGAPAGGARDSAGKSMMSMASTAMWMTVMAASATIKNELVSDRGR